MYATYRGAGQWGASPRAPGGTCSLPSTFPPKVVSSETKTFFFKCQPCPSLSPSTLPVVQVLWGRAPPHRVPFTRLDPPAPHQCVPTDTVRLTLRNSMLFLSPMPQR